MQTEEDDEVEETEVRVMGATLGVMPIKVPFLSDRCSGSRMWGLLVLPPLLWAL